MLTAFNLLMRQHNAISVGRDEKMSTTGRLQVIVDSHLTAISSATITALPKIVAEGILYPRSDGSDMWIFPG